MDDNTQDFLDFDKSDQLIKPKEEDLLVLTDPSQNDPFMSSSSELYHSEKEEKNEDGDKPTVIGNESELAIEINKFAEQFVEPIVKEAIAMHKSETEDDETEVRGESCADKKSDKSSSDDGFEYVKKEEVEKEEHHGDDDTRPSEADEVRRELEDVVFQEELRLESASEEVLPGTTDGYESDDVHCHDLPDEDIALSEVLEEQVDVAEIKDTIQVDVADILHSENSNEFCDTPEARDDEPTLETSIQNEYTPEESLHDVQMLQTSLVNEYTMEMQDHTERPLEMPHHNEHQLETPHHDDSILETLHHDDPVLDSSHHDDRKMETPHHDDNLIGKSFQDEPCLSYEERTQSSLTKPEEHDINGKCKDIINWAHPVSSALAFFILMFVELGLMMEYSIISLLAYSGLLLMLASFLYKIAVNFRLLNTQSSMNCVITFNKEDVEYCVDVTLGWVDYLHKEIKSIAYVESYTKNIKVFILLWVLTYVGQMFNLQSLIFIGSILLFSMPLVYNKFEKEINEATDNVRAHIRGITDKVKSKCQRLTGCH